MDSDYYGIAVELAHQHLANIVEALVTTIQDSNIAIYNDMDETELASIVEPLLKVQLQYLESGDLAEWKKAAVQVISQRRQAGASYGNIIRIGQLVTAALTAFFKVELPVLGTNEGQSFDRLLYDVSNRLQKLNTVVTSTSTNMNFT